MANPEYQPGDYVIIIDAGENPFSNGWIGKLIKESNMGNECHGWDIMFSNPDTHLPFKRFCYLRRFRHATNRELKEYGI